MRDDNKLHRGVCRSHQPGGAGRMQPESAEPNPSAQDFL